MLRVMQCNTKRVVNDRDKGKNICPFDPNLCVFPDHFCTSWLECENCLRKCLQLLNLNKDNEIGECAPIDWEVSCEESIKTSQKRF